MRNWSCDFFGSPEEVQVDRHTSRLVEGEGKPKFSPPCIPPWPNQPFRLLHQNPPCIPPHCCPPLPSWHPQQSSTPTTYYPAQPHRNTPTTRPIQSSGSSQRQGPTFPSITLASPLTLFLLYFFFLTSASLLTSLCLPRFSFPTFTQGPNAPSNHGPAARCWSFKSFVSCIYSCLCSCLT